MATFQKMADVIPEGRSGQVRIDHFEVPDQFDPRWIQHPEEMVAPGRYVRLMVGGDVVMSDVAMEQRTNREAVLAAQGHVLIAGLGLGMVLLPILRKPAVASVTVVECSPDVIGLVVPHLRAAAGPDSVKLTVIGGDIQHWRPGPDAGRIYSTIYFDIWTNVPNGGDYAQMKALHKAFRPHLVKGGWMSSWRFETAQRAAARDRKTERMATAALGGNEWR